MLLVSLGKRKWWVWNDNLANTQLEWNHALYRHRYFILESIFLRKGPKALSKRTAFEVTSPHEGPNQWSRSLRSWMSNTKPFRSLEHQGLEPGPSIFQLHVFSFPSLLTRPMSYPLHFILRFIIKTFEHIKQVQRTTPHAAIIQLPQSPAHHRSCLLSYPPTPHPSPLESKCLNHNLWIHNWFLNVQKHFIISRLGLQISKTLTRGTREGLI